MVSNPRVLRSLHSKALKSEWSLGLCDETKQAVASRGQSELACWVCNWMSLRLLQQWHLPRGVAQSWCSLRRNISILRSPLQRMLGRSRAKRASSPLRVLVVWPCSNEAFVWSTTCHAPPRCPLVTGSQGSHFSTLSRRRNPTFFPPRHFFGAILPCVLPAGLLQPVSLVYADAYFLLGDQRYRGSDISQPVFFHGEVRRLRWGDRATALSATPTCQLHPLLHSANSVRRLKGKISGCKSRVSGFVASSFCFPFVSRVFGCPAFRVFGFDLDLF